MPALIISMILPPSLHPALLEAQQQVIAHQDWLDDWFRSQWQLTPPPLYSSIDLRCATFKLAPVDTNLFPGGFHHIDTANLPLAAEALQQRLGAHHRVLLVVESHGHNQAYFDNVYALTRLLKIAGYQVEVGSEHPSLNTSHQITLEHNRTLTLHPLVRQQNRLTVAHFDPDVIVLNHDQSGQDPHAFDSIMQPILPSPQLGWNRRRKSQHFDHYHQIIATLCQPLNIDPWLLQAQHHALVEIDFNNKSHLIDSADKIDKLLQQTQQQYTQHDIDQPPYAILKSDNGTYGLGIMVIQHAEQLLQLNQKRRKKLLAHKGGQASHHFILQEGIPSAHLVHNHTAEPVLYAVGSQPIGGFWRSHDSKNAQDNLNSPGMSFHPMPTALQAPQMQLPLLTQRAAILAAAREQNDLEASP